MDFYNQLGQVAIGSRLRMLTDKITADAAGIYQLYGIDMQPKWFPVFYALSQGEEKTITGIAKEIRHSHPSVSKIIREMIKKGYVSEKKDTADGRKNVVRLSPKGRAITEKIKDSYTDVGAAIAAISAQSRHDLWQAIEEWEFLLEQETLLKRVKTQKLERENEKVQLIDYTPAYHAAFKALNEEWISTYFKMEAADYKALDNPDKYILDKGGFIIVALYEGQPVGVCALIKMKDPDYDYELAKMAVSPTVQGKGIGWLLGQAVLEKARAQGAAKVYLESNTRLKPAITLYHKLGFQKVVGRITPYERCNIQMECIL
ncbi:bifunctional helix-turn-helix transcriptional regulator/GNAT family N-acetyltransferase [Chitinophaga nivalis]|uniref:Bifunctional helix-turn-helix transcriptional regulator/GNAT family N-acetyltransferase n=1 Tax=Chitinophaga nivalis TaxID=2991709 RepID=A0ABT3IQS7_9BACT|nr:bifunctional helix-turn-helix transcriptional regulator/GNAT family N-acetyltransferase [Chitinophaga nivalis]MCW3463994.1 bifunctional helix-turn-helix transcriptional regulator/GNAT family N-acetyltransferase [Chitinophaga nivalis]MCW3486316.1 bifunctional helix-turn-helix transcriptional regulator/GNAT family N-acetyltransferase [Chitinophaga nivalis]